MTYLVALNPNESIDDRYLESYLNNNKALKALLKTDKPYDLRNKEYKIKDIKEFRRLELGEFTLKYKRIYNDL